MSGNVISEPIGAKYRYIKIILMGASGKKATKTVAEIKLYAETPTAKAPEKADKTELMTLCGEYGTVRNNSGEYSGAAYRDFLSAYGDAMALICKDGASADEISSAQNALKTAYTSLSEPLQIPAETEKATEAAPQTDTGKAAASTGKAEEPGKNAFPILPAVLGVIAAALVAAGIAVVIGASKKKKSNK